METLKKLNFERPTVEITVFDVEDVLTASGDPNEGPFVPNEE